LHYFLLAAPFFGLLAFFVVALLRAFLAGFAALLDEEVAGAEAAALAVPVDDDAVAFLAFAFVLPAAFFFGEAAFFLGLLALALPAALGLAAAFDFGFADLAFLAVVAFFLVAAAVVAVAVAGAVAVDEALASVAAVALVLALATFFVAAFFVGDAERFRLVAPPADFPLLDERAFFVDEPLVFLLPLGVFDRLRDFVDEDFFAVAFLVPAADALFFAGVANLKLPLAPTPLVCFNDLFFVPARSADLRCWLAVVAFTLKLARIYFKMAALDVPLRSFS